MPTSHYIFSPVTVFSNSSVIVVLRARPFTNLCPPGRKGLVTHAHTYGSPGIVGKITKSVDLNKQFYIIVLKHNY